MDYFTLAVDGGGTSLSAPIVAGAAAVLKAARPGLTAPHYRSLLINSASPILDAAGNPLGAQQVGTGLRNLVSSLRNSVAAYPTSLSFGAAAGSVEVLRNLTLTNLGTSDDTLTITAAPFGAGPAPRPSLSTLKLAPQASSRITLEFAGSSLPPGEYQGFVRITSTASPVQTNVPYWFGVTGSGAANLSILYVYYGGSAGQNDPGAILFQVTDAAGVPLGGITPQATTDSLGAGVHGIVPVGDVAGVYELNVRLGVVDSVFTIKAGSATRRVWIPAN